MKAFLIKVINKIPYLCTLYSERVKFAKNCCFPPGHFCSIIIDVEDIKTRQNEIWLEEAID